MLQVLVIVFLGCKNLPLFPMSAMVSCLFSLPVSPVARRWTVASTTHWLRWPRSARCVTTPPWITTTPRTATRRWERPLRPPSPSSARRWTSSTPTRWAWARRRSPPSATASSSTPGRRTSPWSSLATGSPWAYTPRPTSQPESPTAQGCSSRVRAQSGRMAAQC